MPFRPEFEKAGLAVTSKDQSKRIQSYITKAVEAGATDDAQKAAQEAATQEPVKAKTTKASQMDGFDDTEPSDSPNTEISFARSNDMDEWRYALIDEVPDKKKKKKAAKGKKKRRCFPCLGASPSVTTDTDWAHFKQPRAAVPKFRKDIGPPPSVPPPPPPQPPPPRPPRPAVGLYDEPEDDQKSPDNQTSTSHMISPRRLPPRKTRSQTGIRSPIGRRNTPFPKDYSLGGRSRRQSSKKSTKESRPIPHPATAVQFKRPGESSYSPSKRDDSKKPSGVSSLPEDCGMDHDRNHIGICCRSQRGLPSRANARPNIPRRTSSMSRLVSSASIDYDDQEITDRDVLRGLHIAASAACDEEVDAFVRSRTGLRIRRFLADLMALETLGEIRPGEDRERWARRRRAEMRKLKQQIRRSREISKARPF